jgi:hypothetical protein
VAWNKATGLGEDQPLEGLRKAVEGWCSGWNRSDMPTRRADALKGRGTLWEELTIRGCSLLWPTRLGGIREGLCRRPEARERMNPGRVNDSGEGEGRKTPRVSASNTVGGPGNRIAGTTHAETLCGAR